jgi:hypothetical protein
MKEAYNQIEAWIGRVGNHIDGQTLLEFLRGGAAMQCVPSIDLLAILAGKAKLDPATISLHPNGCHDACYHLAVLKKVLNPANSDACCRNTNKCSE